MSTESPEPKDSASSSPGECRACGHSKDAHLMRETYGQRGCQWQMLDYEIEDRVICPCEGFIPADAETAGEPKRIDLDCIRPTGCRDKLSPGCAYGCAEAADEVTRQGQEMEAPPPRRPPYVVAYTIASGEMYEVALPGDAVATVEHGVLKISHPAGVACILQVRPTGEQ